MLLYHQFPNKIFITKYYWRRSGIIRANVWVSSNNDCKRNRVVEVPKIQMLRVNKIKQTLKNLWRWLDSWNTVLKNFQSISTTLENKAQ